MEVAPLRGPGYPGLAAAASGEGWKSAAAAWGEDLCRTVMAKEGLSSGCIERLSTAAVFAAPHSQAAPAALTEHKDVRSFCP